MEIGSVGGEIEGLRGVEGIPWGVEWWVKWVLGDYEVDLGRIEIEH